MEEMITIKLDIESIADSIPNKVLLAERAKRLDQLEDLENDLDLRENVIDYEAMIDEDIFTDNVEYKDFVKALPDILTKYKVDLSEFVYDVEGGDELLAREKFSDFSTDKEKQAYLCEIFDLPEFAANEKKYFTEVIDELFR